MATSSRRCAISTERRALGKVQRHNHHQEYGKRASFSLQPHTPFGKTFCALALIRRGDGIAVATATGHAR